MLFLHGYGSKKESFYYQIKFFEKYFKVTAADFPGFGNSGEIDSGWSVADYVIWLKKFMEAASVKTPHIVAHSFGARVAIKLLSQDGDAAEKLVITGGAGIVKPRSKKYIRRVNAYRRIKKLFPKYAEKHFGSQEYRRLPPIMKESYKKIVNEDLTSAAAQIKNRTLLIYGAEDSVTPFNDEGKIFNSLIANSLLVGMHGCGHFCFSEKAEIFNEEVLRFLL